ncbi:4'-phosphopantetheinyl transferase [Aspergillus uvarum CBS 121591]|uniref:holo-[acyl-carrier-protein] synthase n=1 Tax=Aspergillus uvarum CBS 121591 TaxID=1448315 RepID=A0A319CJN4_9EURO|nr:4'-phosphopantetheinyl transferase [Aspergillus uvarum CBS 121591]PYH85434.1 4'-phosphopantetheinyl transferase [Aspergillus uvarum CBS 121591]
MTTTTTTTTNTPPKPPTLTRWYIDTRPLTATANPANLPLITTLQPDDQTSIRRFHHLKDKHMSLASNLLKYLFIHRSCRIPWDRITLSRTPAPHRRPCFIPSAALLTEQTTAHKAIPSIEFNVSHQASLVALAGTIIPTDGQSTEGIPQVGIDITCTNERQPSSSKSNAPTAPRATFTNYVDIFAEVFSAEEIRLIKTLQPPTTHDTPQESSSDGLEYSYRVFYAYWALKEAYIKMTGEALLAPWLRELEFAGVVAPEPGSPPTKVGEPYTGVRTTLHKQPVEAVRVEIVAFEQDYLIATAARGPGIGARRGGGADTAQQDTWEALREIDIERDVRPCAEGRCRCLE